MNSSLLSHTKAVPLGHKGNLRKYFLAQCLQFNEANTLNHKTNIVSLESITK